MAWNTFSQKENRSKIAGRIVNAIYENFLREGEKMVERRLIRFERRMFQRMQALVIISTGIIFLIISAVFFFIEFLALTNTVSFLIVGIILLGTGIIINLAGRK